MERSVHWIILLVFIFSIDLGFSAVFFYFERRNPVEDYVSSRSASVHRGVILSLSSAKRFEMCKDMFSIYNVGKLTSSVDLQNVGEPDPPIIVAKINYFTLDHVAENEIDDLFFLCSGGDLKISYADGVEYYVSSAYQRGLMYKGSSEAFISKMAVKIMVDNYSGMSPEYVSLVQTELEKQYIASRQNLEALRMESPEYVNMIEKRDNISQLSVWQKYLLCTSIMLSPNHEKAGREFPFYWGHYEKNAETGNHQYQQKQLKFDDNNYVKEWSTDCLYCRASSNPVQKPPDHSTNLLLTRAYNDKHSLYVLIERNGVVRLHEFFKNAPILMNAHVPLTNDPELVIKY